MAWEVPLIIEKDEISAFHNILNSQRTFKFIRSDNCRIRAIYKHGFTGLCFLVQIALGTTLHM